MYIGRIFYCLLLNVCLVVWPLIKPHYNGLLPLLFSCFFNTLGCFVSAAPAGMFSYASLLTKLLASFTLIPLIPTLIEIAILYLLPGSVRYKKSVIEVEAGVEAESDEVGEADSDSSQDSPSAGGATCDTKRSEDEHCPDVENLPKALQGVTSDQTESSVPDGTQQREVTEAGDGLLVKNGSSSKDGSTARQRLAKSAGDEQ